MNVNDTRSDDLQIFWQDNLSVYTILLSTESCKAIFPEFSAII